MSGHTLEQVSARASGETAAGDRLRGAVEERGRDGFQGDGPLDPATMKARWEAAARSFDTHIGTDKREPGEVHSARSEPTEATPDVLSFVKSSNTEVGTKSEDPTGENGAPTGDALTAAEKEVAELLAQAEEAAVKAEKLEKTHKFGQVWSSADLIIFSTYTSGHAERDLRAFEAYDAGEDTYQTEAVRRYKMIQRWQKSVVDVFGVQPIIFGVDQNVHPTPTSCDVLNKWNLSCTDEPRYPHFTKGNQARDGGRVVAVDAKHWYASYFLDQGKTVLFSDIDLVFFRNGRNFVDACPGLCILSDDQTPDDKFMFTLSTGLWAAHPTKETKATFQDMLGRMKEETQTEQDLFRRTTEQQPDVKSKNQTWFRVWSKSAVSNFDVAMARRAKGLPAGCSVIHFGYVYGAENKNRLHEAISEFPESHGLCASFDDSVTENIFIAPP